MILFHSDLDNTLIYSHKRDIGPGKRCVEVYQGREVSFMTCSAQDSLRALCRRVLFVPTTTRSAEQYGRVRFGLGDPGGGPAYALVANGGVLLANGSVDGPWLADSLRLAMPARGELMRARGLLERDADRCFEVRTVDALFLFTKSAQPAATAARLKEHLDGRLVDVHWGGVKVYVLPRRLDKGTAVRRFRAWIGEREPGCGLVAAAGDSAFDLPMLREADVALMPWELKDGAGFTGAPVFFKNGIFSDRLLRYLLKLTEEIGHPWRGEDI